MTQQLFDKKRRYDNVMENFRVMLYNVKLSDFPNHYEKYLEYREQLFKVNHEIVSHQPRDYMAIIKHECSDKVEHLTPQEEIYHYFCQIVLAEARIAALTEKLGTIAE